MFAKKFKEMIGFEFEIEVKKEEKKVEKKE